MLKRLLAATVLAGSVLALGAAPALAQSTRAADNDHDHGWGHDNDHGWGHNNNHDHGWGHDHRWGVRVTDAAPLTQQPTCGTYGNIGGYGKIAAPTVRGVNYTIKQGWYGSSYPMTSGRWYSKTPGTYQVEAHALPGYDLQGLDSWTITLSTPRCRR